MITDASGTIESDVRLAICTCVKSWLQLGRKCDMSTSDLYGSALVGLGAAHPSVLRHSLCLGAIGALLKRESSSLQALRGKGSPLDMQITIAVRLLRTAVASLPTWPSQLMKLYVADASGDRLWVDREECRSLATEIEAAFRTVDVDIGLVTPGEEAATPSSSASENTQHVSASDTSSSESAKPFAAMQATLGPTVVQLLNDTSAKRSLSGESSLRNLLKFLTTAAGLPEIRQWSMQRMETWLASTLVQGGAK